MRTTINEFQTAMEQVDEVLLENDERHKSIWLSQSPAYHAEHAIQHLKDFIATGDRENISNATTRALMALERFLEVC